MNRSLLKFSAIGCLFVAVLLSSCSTKTDETEVLNDQNRFFINYIKNTYGTNNDSLKAIAENLYMITRKIGTGLTPTLTADSADFVKICYTGRVLSSDGSTVFTTTNRLLAYQAGVSAVSPIQDTVYLNIGAQGISKPWAIGLKKGLTLMREGGKALFLLNPSWAYGASSASLSYEVELIKVIKNPINHDTVRLAKSLKVFNKSLNDSVKSAGASFYLINETAGTNDTLAVAGDSVYIKYTGHLLADKETLSTRADVVSGKVFDYSDKFGTVIDSKTTVAGFNAALKHIKLGSTGFFILPYFSAYGVAGSLPKVPQYSSLIFEYQVLRIKRK